MSNQTIVVEAETQTTIVVDGPEFDFLAEEQARIDADTALQEAIDDEEQARIDANIVLQTNMDNEEQSRIDADTALQEAIDDEVDARAISEALLQLKSEKGVANGYAGLTAGGVLDDSIIPSGITRDSELSLAISSAVATIMGGLPPGTLDSLVELATAINNDPVFATTITALIDGKVALDTYNANTVLAATTDNNPAAITIGEATVLGRLVGGNIAALSAANLKTLLSLVSSDITNVGTGKFLGRVSSGSGPAEELTPSQVKFVLAISTDDVIGLGTIAGLSAPDGTVVGTIDTQTLSNKRIVSRVTTITSSATPTINTDNCDAVTITALAANITSMTTNLSGTPNNFDKLTIRIKDDGSARTIAWGGSWASRGATLPTTTVAAKLLTIGFVYNSVTSIWGCVAVAQEV